MITRYAHKDLAWIDVEAPTQDEVRTLALEFGIHPLIAEELLAPSLRPRVDMHKDFLYLILHFPAIRHTHVKDGRQEIDFVIGKKFLITVHYDTIDALHKFSKEFEVNSILNRHDIGDHAGFLFFFLIKKLYLSLEHELEHIESRLIDAENRIFSGGEKKMVMALLNINRDLIDLKQALRTHKDVLKSLEVAGAKFFGEDFSFYLQAVSGEFYKVAGMLDGHKETLVDLRETNDSMLSTKTGAIMKTFTVLSFSTFPPMLIASIFSMNTTGVPLIGNPYDFWIVVGLMTLSTVFVFLYLRYEKWL